MKTILALLALTIGCEGNMTAHGFDPLDPRAMPPSSYGRPQNRWGQRALIAIGDPVATAQFGARNTVTVVDTELFKDPTAWIVQFRYQLTTAATRYAIDETAWTTIVPASHRQSIIRGIDALGGRAPTAFDLLVTINHPAETLLAHSLQIEIGPLLVAGPSAMWVEVFAVPICCFDPTLIAAPAGGLGGYGTTVVTRVAANVANVQLVAANPARRQFYIHNNSVQDMAVLLGPGAASFAAGAENFSFILPASAFATYESPIGGYTGPINAIWRAADAAGEALITQGFF